MSVHKYYKISNDGKIVRLNRFCPRCGPGFFMAKNYDRETCGQCGYTEFGRRTPKKEKSAAKKAKAKNSQRKKINK